MKKRAKTQARNRESEGKQTIQPSQAVSEKSHRDLLEFDYGNMFLFREHAKRASHLLRAGEDEKKKTERETSELVDMIEKHYIRQSGPDLL